MMLREWLRRFLADLGDAFLRTPPAWRRVGIIEPPSCTCGSWNDPDCPIHGPVNEPLPPLGKEDADGGW